jgi:hypothetical protein
MARLMTPPVAVMAAFLMPGPALAVTSWTFQQPPALASASFSVLVGVSCPSASACMAVGVSGGPGGGIGPPGSFTDSWNGTSWVLESIPWAAVTTLTAVSCRSGTWCVAVGYVTNSTTGLNMPRVLRWNGQRWSALTVPMPAGDTDGTLSGVSCVSRSSCVAVGAGKPTTGTVTSFSETWNGTVWKPSGVPGTGTRLAGVTCTSGVSCVAVGGNSGAPVADSWDGTSWTVQTVPLDAGGYPASLAGVSCGSAASCVAVGAYVSNESHALIYRWDGRSWTQQTATGYQNRSSSLTGVACARIVCTAVGNVILNGDQQVLAAHWTGTRWYRDTAVAVPPRSSSSYLNGVSCHSWGTCVAVGDFIQPSGAVSLAEHESAQASLG